MKKQTAQEQTTPGTKIAEKARSRANGYSDTKRQELLEIGMGLIYGGGKKHVKSHGNRG